jgi:hypothetical protein
VDIDDIKRKSWIYYRRDAISKLYRTATINRIQCLNNTKTIAVFFDIPNLVDAKPVFVLNNNGQLIGKFLSSSYGIKSWQ